MRREALIIESSGERFRFYYEVEAPEELHITFRHGTTPEEAIRTYFDGLTVWDGRHQRFQTETDSLVLLWTRHAFDGAVLAISCFRQGD